RRQRAVPVHQRQAHPGQDHHQGPRVVSEDFTTKDTKNTKEDKEKTGYSLFSAPSFVFFVSFVVNLFFGDQSCPSPVAIYSGQHRWRPSACPSPSHASPVSPGPTA